MAHNEASVVKTPVACDDSQSSENQNKRAKSRLVRGIWAGVGMLFFVLALIGVALPILPTTPFVLLAAFCFARSSKRVEDWFKSTKLYKKVLESYVQDRTMDKKQKASVLIPVTLLMGFGAFCMRAKLIPVIILGFVWLGHIIYFGFIVKEPQDK